MCTNILDSEESYICATEVDSNGKLTAWDYCDACCPGASVETTPQLQADPANEPGNCCKLCIKKISYIKDTIPGISREKSGLWRSLADKPHIFKILYNFS